MKLSPEELQKFREFASRPIGAAEILLMHDEAKEFTNAIHAAIPGELGAIVLQARMQLTSMQDVPRVLQRLYISGLAFGMEFARYLMLEEMYGKKEG